MTLEEVKRDLQEIRYFYTCKSLFDKVADVEIYSRVADKAALYNKAISFAPAHLFDIYVAVYVNGNTQGRYARESGYSCGNIKKLNQELKEYLLREIARKKEEKAQ